MHLRRATLFYGVDALQNVFENVTASLFFMKDTKFYSSIHCFILAQ